MWVAPRAPPGLRLRLRVCVSARLCASAACACACLRVSTCASAALFVCLVGTIFLLYRLLRLEVLVYLHARVIRSELVRFCCENVCFLARGPAPMRSW